MPDGYFAHVETKAGLISMRAFSPALSGHIDAQSILHFNEANCAVGRAQVKKVSTWQRTTRATTITMCDTQQSQRQQTPSLIKYIIHTPRHLCRSIGVVQCGADADVDRFGIVRIETRIDT